MGSQIGFYLVLLGSYFLSHFLTSISLFNVRRIHQVSPHIHPHPLHLPTTSLTHPTPCRHNHAVVQNFINGKFVDSSATSFIDVTNPATNEVICRVPESTRHEMEEAAGCAQEAFGTWREVPVQQRQRVMFELQKLVRDNTEEIARSITLEQGKTLPDARGDVFRGLEIVEMSSAIGHLMMGETQGNLSTGIDSYSYHEPLGVTAGICPFNFPAMIPLWMFPVAITAGNTSVMKPSEKDPGAMMILAKLAQEAGVPDGVLNIIHGGHDAVNFICDAPEIKAISFVGGNEAGEYIHARGTGNGKR